MKELWNWHVKMLENPIYFVGSGAIWAVIAVGTVVLCTR